MSNKETKKKTSTNNEIPEMNLNNKYNNVKIPTQDTKRIKKDIEKTKKELDKLKNFIIKKYKFVQSISILPPQAVPKFIEEEEIPKETEKYPQVIIIIPEEYFKKINKIKTEIIKYTDALKEKVWIQIKTPVDIWEYCLDSKFELVQGISMSYPLHDKGILGALRITEIHKSLVLQKFEKYVVSYVIGGGFVRGEIHKNTDIDVFIVINDTDVKKMPRIELKERLRTMIYQYVAEAASYAGTNNKLEPQIWLLTDFWERVKDAEPVAFTFIRDGVPLYDQGTFLPWKALLKMGKLKPSPEAIDSFMSIGDKTVNIAKRKLLDIVVHDIYWSVVTPAQALIMLNGKAPPTHKEILQGAFRKEFVEKEKIIEKKYADILEEIVQIYKDYEHEKIKEIKGEKVDRLIKNTELFLKRAKELRKQIEKKYNEKTIEQIYKDVLELIKPITNKRAKEDIIKKFEKLVKQGKFSRQDLRTLKNIFSVKEQFKKGKINSHEVNEARKNAAILINNLIEFSQRCEIANYDKKRIKLKYKENGKEKYAEILDEGGKVFLFKDKEIKEITNKIKESNMEEVTQSVESKIKKSALNDKTFDLIKKELGNFEFVY